MLMASFALLITCGIYGKHWGHFCVWDHTILWLTKVCKPLSGLHNIKQNAKILQVSKQWFWCKTCIRRYHQPTPSLPLISQHWSLTKWKGGDGWAGVRSSGWMAIDTVELVYNLSPHFSNAGGKILSPLWSKTQCPGPSLFTVPNPFLQCPVHSYSAQSLLTVPRSLLTVPSPFVQCPVPSYSAQVPSYSA